MTIKELLAMELHKTTTVGDHEFTDGSKARLEILRVPGGWVYSFSINSATTDTISQTFVPEPPIATHKSKIDQALSVLTNQECRVIRMAEAVDINHWPTDTEIGKIMLLPVEQVADIRNEAIRKLKANNNWPL